MKIEDAINQRKFESPLHKAIINLLYTYNWLSDKQQATFQQFDVTLQQYNVLRILRGQHPNAVSVGDVKAVMLDKNPDLTRLCDRLVKKKLVKRELNVENRRQVLLKILPLGLDLLKKMEPSMKVAMSSMKLTDTQAQQLSDLLDKIRE